MGLHTIAYAQDVDARDVDSDCKLDCDLCRWREWSPAGPVSCGPVSSSRSRSSASTEAGTVVAERPLF